MKVYCIWPIFCITLLLEREIEREDCMRFFIKLVLVCLFVMDLSGLFANPLANDGENYFKFNISKHQELETITRIISIANVKNNTVWAYANSKELANFQKLNYQITFLPHPSTLTTVRTTSDRDSLRTWDVYPTYEGYIDLMNQFVADFPEICRLENIGTTIEGRALLFLVISDNVNTEEAEPEVMYSSSIHGNEPLGYVTMLHFIDYLTSNYNQDTRVTNMVNNLEIWINPLANPDGTYHGGNNSVNGAWRYNSNEIDMNRNFPDPAEGDHPDGEAWQPETIAMKDFIASHHFVISANFHGGVEVLNYPWDCFQRVHKDDAWLQTICRAYADTAQANAPNGYMDDFENGITNGWAWFPVHGGRQDYTTYFCYGREVTIELSNDYIVPNNQLLNHWNYNYQSLLKYLENAYFGIRGIITDISGNPVNAQFKVNSHDGDHSQVFTDPDFGDYYRPIAPGTYNVTVSATGYTSQIINGVVVNEGAATILNVTLTPANPPQVIDFNPGWNLMSLNLHPVNMNIRNIFSPILDHVLQIKDMNSSFDPLLPDTQNTLTSLTDGQAYWVNTDSLTQLSVYSPTPGLNSAIPLNQGWNLVGFTPQTPQDTETSLSSIMPHLLQIKSTNQTYIPGYPSFLSNMLALIPDKGYWIKVSEPCTLTYGTTATQNFPENNDLRTPPDWEPLISPTNSATILGTVKAVGFYAQQNDVFAAFRGDSCVGKTIVNNVNGVAYFSMIINLNEETESINFKLYRASVDSLYYVNYPLQITSGAVLGSYPDSLVNFDCLLVGNQDDVLGTTFTKIVNYPNPFNPETTISYNLRTKTKVDLSIYNTKGQLIKTLVNTEQPAGKQTVIWNGKDHTDKPVASGIYFYKLSTANFKKINKMLLIK